MNRFRHLPSYHYEDNIDGILKKSVGKPLRDYKIYGDSVQNVTNLFDGIYKNGYITTNKVSGFSETVGNQYLAVIPCEPNTSYVVEKEYATERFVVGFTNEYPYTNCAVTDSVSNYTGKKITATSGENSQYLIAFVYNKTIDTLPLPNVEVYKTQSPTNPIEVESVGEKTKNLFSLNSYEGFVDWSADSKNTINKATVEPNTYYTLSFQNFERIDPITGGNIVIYIYNNASLSETGRVHSYSINISGSAEPIRFKETFRNGANTELYVVIRNVIGTKTQIKIEGLMLEEGSTATEYEPYGYRIPVISRGKNLFDINSVELTKNCEIANNGIRFTGNGECDILFPAGQYTISFENNGIGACYIRNGKVASGYIAIISTTDTVKTFSYNANVDGYLRITSFSAGQTLSNIQIEEGTTATEYEPYIEPVTSNIYLNEPLRKIGDYADYIDYKNQKVVRKICKSKPYGTTNSGTAYNSGLCRHQFQPSPLPNFGVSPLSNCLIGNSGGIVVKANNTTFNSTYKNIYTYFNCSDVGIEVPDATTTNTTIGTAIKSYIDEKGIYICYVLEEEISEDIELPTIPTHKGTTIIEVDTSIAPSNMEVTYYGKENITEEPTIDSVRFVCVGNDGTSYYSTNGTSWTAMTGLGTVSGYTTYFEEVAFGNGKYVCVASTTSATVGTSYYSTNGTTWAGKTSLSTGFSQYGICYGKDRFVVVGASGKSYYSLDGVSWTAMTGLANKTYRSVTFGNGRFVCVGNGASAYSTDGITWTAMTGLSSSYTYRSVTFGNGRFVCVGESGKSYYSLDGTTWVAMTGLSSTMYYGVCYGKDRFVCVGTLKSYYSTDGTTWVAMTGIQSTMLDVAYGLDRFMCVGVAGNSYYSTDGETWSYIKGLSTSNEFRGLICGGI